MTTRSAVLISLLVGVVLGFVLAKLIVSAAALIAVALIIVGVVVVAYYVIRRRARDRGVGAR